MQFKYDPSPGISPPMPLAWMLPFVVLCLASPLAHADLPTSVIGPRIDQSPSQAESFHWDFASAERATAVVFLSASCPCSGSHEPKLKNLASEFRSRGIQFVGVHANADESETEGKAHFRSSALGFPVVRDEANLANAFGALKTPHVFLVNKTGEVVYSGGVDDSKDPSRARNEYLKDALAAITADRLPNPAMTRTLGCIIKRKKP